MDQLSAHYLLSVPHRDLSTSIKPGTHINWAETFDRNAPLIIEIGSGVGDSLVAMASEKSDHNVIAFEVYAPALASTMIKLDRANVTNVRLIAADGTDGLRELIGDGELSELWTFFPDPWPKKRHLKRRLVQPTFAKLVAHKLAPGGLWRLATDWPEYARWMRTVLDAEPFLENICESEPDGWAPRAERPMTRFEKRGIAAGRPIRDMVYRRTPIKNTDSKQYLIRSESSND